MDLPRGTRLKHGSLADLSRFCEELPKGFNGSVFFFIKSTKRFFEASLLLSEGKITAASVKDVDDATEVSKSEAVEELAMKVAESSGDVDIFSFSDFDMKISVERNLYAILDSPIELSIFLSSIGIEVKKKAAEVERLREEEEAARLKIESEKKRIEEERIRRDEEKRRWEAEKRRLEEERLRKDAEERRRKDDEERRRRLEEERARKESEERKKREDEERQRKIEEERRRKAVEEARRQAEEQARRIEEERRKKEEAEKARKEEAERNKREEEARRRAEEEEKKRKAEEERLRKEEEEARKRKAEEEAKRAAEEARKRKVEEERARKEEAERQKRETEEQQRRIEEAKKKAESEKKAEEARKRKVEEESRIKAEIEEEVRVKAEEEMRKADAKRAAEAAKASEKQSSGPEAEARNRGRSKIAEWKERGYVTESLERALESDVGSFNNALKKFEFDASVLQRIEKQLDSLDTVGFEDRAKAIRSKLRDTQRLVDLMNEVTQLEKEIDAKKSRKVQAPAAASAPAASKKAVAEKKEEKKKEVAKPPVPEKGVSKKDSFANLLRNLELSVKDIKGVAVATKNGLPVAVRLPRELDVEAFCGMSAAMFGAAETTMMELKRSALLWVYTETDDSTLIVVDAGSSALLVALIGAGANIGLVLVKLKYTADTVRTLMK